MKKIILVTITLLLWQQAFAQPGNTIDGILQQIEANNTTLSALRQQSEAQKIGNKTGIYLANPEVEFHYLWGNELAGGNRVDFSASQSFDFPTAYYQKRKLTEGKNAQIDLQYQLERKAILLQANQQCIQLIYYNSIINELSKRQQHAQQIADAYKSQFDKGQTNVLEYNKAQLSLLNAAKEVDTKNVERTAVLTELTRLNGGKPIESVHPEYIYLPISADFEQWYAVASEKNPMLQYLQQEIKLSKQNEKLMRSMNLPKLSVGYMTEQIAGENLGGIMVGISVPLWENKNTVKHIKAQTQAHEQVEYDARIQFYNQLKAKFEKVQGLQHIANNYKETLPLVNNADLLLKALNKGEISLIQYVMELSIYYEAVTNLLETERDLQLVLAELKQWEIQ